MNKDMSNIRSALEDLLSEVGITQKELAALSEISPSTISRIKSDKRSPRYEEIDSLANTFLRKGASSQEVDKLWAAAGIERRNGEFAAVNPLLEMSNEILRKLPPDMQELYGRLIFELAEVAQNRNTLNHLLSERHWDKAIEKYESSFSKIVLIAEWLHYHNEMSVGLAYYSRGEFIASVRHYESALWGIRQIAQIEDGFDIRYEEAELLTRLGSVHRRMGGLVHWKRSRKLYRDAEKIFREIDEAMQVAICKRKIAGLYLAQGDAQKALPLCATALDVFKKESSNKGIYKTYQHQAWAYSLLGDWERVEELFRKATNLIKKYEEDDWEKVKHYRYLADSNRNQKKLDDAVKYYTKAMLIIEKYEAVGIGVQIVAGMIWLGLAKTYMEMPGQEQEARGYLQDYMKAMRDVKGEDIKLADGWSQYGYTLLHLDRINDAEKYLQQARHVLKDSGQVHYFVDCLGHLAELYLLQGKSTLVYKLSREAQKYDTHLPALDPLFAQILITEGKAHIADGRPPDAITPFSEAIERGIRFNRIVLDTIMKDISDSMQHLMREGAEEEAMELYDGLQESLEELYFQKDIEMQVVEAQAKLRHQLEEITLKESAGT